MTGHDAAAEFQNGSGQMQEALRDTQITKLRSKHDALF